MVPMLVGLAPENSVVLVLFVKNRTQGAMRIDLPPNDDQGALRRWATSVIGLVCKVTGVTGLLPVVYTPDTFAPTGRLPRADVLRALGRRGEHAGLEMKGLLCVAPDGWGSPDDADLPRGGHDLQQIEPLPIDAYGSRTRLDTLPEFPAATDAGTTAFWDAVEAWWLTVGGPLGADGTPVHGVDLRRPGAAFQRHDRHEGSAFHRMRYGREIDTAVDLIEASLAAHDEDPDRPCPCLALLYSFSRRDGLSGMVLAQIGWGTDAARRCWRSSMEPHLADELGPLIGGRTAQRPDPDRVQHAIRLLLTIGSHVTPRLRAGVDAMLAWLHWSLGACTIAARLAERSLDVDPDQALAGAVLRLANGLPEWAYGPPELAVPA